MNSNYPEFTESLALVLRDLRAQCAVLPDVREKVSCAGAVIG